MPDTVKHKPATPLPWTWQTYPSFAPSRMQEPEYRARVNQDDKYKIHACNAYPRLILQLRAYLALQKKYIEEAGPCDHSVNICVCGLVADAEETETLLKDLDEEIP